MTVVEDKNINKLELPNLYSILDQGQLAILSEVEASLRNLETGNISHEDLGEKFGFVEGQIVIDKFCLYINKILRDLESWAHKLPSHLLTQTLSQLKSHLSGAINTASQISVLASKGPSNEKSYDSLRTRHLQSLESSYIGLEPKIYPVIQAVRQCELEKRINELSVSDIESTLNQAINDFSQESSELIADISSKSNQAKTLLNSATDKANHQQLKADTNRYEGLRQHHHNWEIFWLIMIGFSSIALVVFAVFALNTPIADVDLKSVLEFVRRIAWVTIPSLFLRISLTKYNTERGLATTYANRIAVMEQTKVWEAVIKDDERAKEQLRMQLAQYLCSDPQPLFFAKDSGQNNGQDINISPLISALDKMPTGK